MSTSYKLEVWGAQGGNDVFRGGTVYHTGGLGGYSYGNYSATKDKVLYVVVGGKGVDNNTDNKKVEKYGGGYNGGGDSYGQGSAGGGATHIATKTGILSALSSSKSSVLIVAGGGGGLDYGGSWIHNGGAGGGGNELPEASYGNNKTATTSSGYAFGKGQDQKSDVTNDKYDTGAGGGGYYGGFSGIDEDQGENKSGGSYGGGGSAYCNNTYINNYGGKRGVQTGNGKSIISWHPTL